MCCKLSQFKKTTLGASSHPVKLPSVSLTTAGFQAWTSLDKQTGLEGLADDSLIACDHSCHISSTPVSFCVCFVCRFSSARAGNPSGCVSLVPSADALLFSQVHRCLTLYPPGQLPVLHEVLAYWLAQRILAPTMLPKLGAK